MPHPAKLHTLVKATIAQHYANNPDKTEFADTNALQVRAFETLTAALANKVGCALPDETAHQTSVRTSTLDDIAVHYADGSVHFAIKKEDLPSAEQVAALQTAIQPFLKNDVDLTQQEPYKQLQPTLTALFGSINLDFKTAPDEARTNKGLMSNLPPKKLSEWKKTLNEHTASVMVGAPFQGKLNTAVMLGVGLKEELIKALNAQGVTLDEKTYADKTHISILPGYCLPETAESKNMLLLAFKAIRERNIITMLSTVRAAGQAAKDSAIECETKFALIEAKKDNAEKPIEPRVQEWMDCFGDEAKKLWLDNIEALIREKGGDDKRYAIDGLMLTAQDTPNQAHRSQALALKLKPAELLDNTEDNKKENNRRRTERAKQMREQAGIQYMQAARSALGAKPMGFLPTLHITLGAPTHTVPALTAHLTQVDTAKVTGGAGGSGEPSERADTPIGAAGGAGGGAGGQSDTDPTNPYRLMPAIPDHAAKVAPTSPQAIAKMRAASAAVPAAVPATAPAVPSTVIKTDGKTPSPTTPTAGR